LISLSSQAIRVVLQCISNQELLQECFNALVADFRLWIYTPTSLQRQVIGLISQYSTQLLSSSRAFHHSFDVLKNFYWLPDSLVRSTVADVQFVDNSDGNSEQSSQSSQLFATSPFIHPITKEPVADRPSLDDLFTLREFLLQRLICTREVSDTEAEPILSELLHYLRTCGPSPAQMIDGLYALRHIATQRPDRTFNFLSWASPLPFGQHTERATMVSSLPRFVLLLRPWNITCDVLDAKELAKDPIEETREQLRTIRSLILDIICVLHSVSVNPSERHRLGGFPLCGNADFTGLLRALLFSRHDMILSRDELAALFAITTAHSVLPNHSTSTPRQIAPSNAAEGSSGPGDPDNATIVSMSGLSLILDGLALENPDSDTLEYALRNMARLLRLNPKNVPLFTSQPNWHQKLLTIYNRHFQALSQQQSLGNRSDGIEDMVVEVLSVCCLSIFSQPTGFRWFMHLAICIHVTVSEREDILLSQILIRLLEELRDHPTRFGRDSVFWTSVSKLLSVAMWFAFGGSLSNIEMAHKEVIVSSFETNHNLRRDGRGRWSDWPLVRTIFEACTVCKVWPISSEAIMSELPTSSDNYSDVSRFPRYKFWGLCVLLVLGTHEPAPVYREAMKYLQRLYSMAAIARTEVPDVSFSQKVAGWLWARSPRSRVEPDLEFVTH
jgi:hypothetical protein